jgi:tetratricopeptide (TPR) repeat protein
MAVRVQLDPMAADALSLMDCMRRALLLLPVVLCAGEESARYELRGRLTPATRASVWLHGATSPFEDSTLSDDDGNFRFRDLAAGTYTLGAFVPGRGELRRTIEVGPSLADAKNRIRLVVELRDEHFESRDSLRREALVSTRELAIPEPARREYEEAEKRLARRDVDGAVAHFRRAVEIAPRFSAAWNHLGTIAYQTRDYARAESCFRKALEADPKSFQPLVNLGGVLINLSKLDEALRHNMYAVLTRPNDALANSQLGMTYFYLNKLDLSQKYLTVAKQIDPAHFSHPQLLLAEIDLRRQDRAAAAGELDEFLKYHPDWPAAGKIKEELARLRGLAALQASAALRPDPAQSYAATGMARSFSEPPDLPLRDAGRYSVVRKDGRYYLQSRDGGGLASIDGVAGSGRQARALMHRSKDGAWMQLPLILYTDGSGRYEPVTPGQTDCLSCHAAKRDEHPEAMGCARCHGAGDTGTPTQTVCLECHLPAGGPNSVHGAGAAAADSFELNSAAYRLLESRCYRNAPGKLTCMSCHPAHSFAREAAGYREVCRSCHPTMHNGAALDCVRCHMPKRKVQDDGQVMMTDHRIQRPL